MVAVLSNADVRTFYGDNFLDITNSLIEAANTNISHVRYLKSLKDELSEINQKKWSRLSERLFKTKQSEIERLKKELNSRACEIARGKYKEDEADVYEPFPIDYLFSFEIDHSKIKGLKGNLRDSPEILKFSPLIETELELEFYKHREDPLKELKKAIHDVRIYDDYCKDSHMVIFSRPKKTFDSNGKTSKTGSSTSFSALVEYPQKSPTFLNASMRYCIAGDGNRITLSKGETEDIGKLVDIVTNSLQESAR